VLTAAQVNTFLMEQAVMRFADSAARTAALSGVLAEGMVSYLQDTNTLEVYDGSGWVGATGDITALTAGTGISITSETGPVPTVAIDTAVTVDLTTAQTLTTKTLTSPVLTTPSISNIDAKGDILVGTADNTLGVITAGANGETLVADSSATTGLRWQGDYAAGKNKIINGDFGIWQRGTSFTGALNGVYTVDRWSVAVTTSVSGLAWTASQQTFTPGTAPVAGYEGTYFLRADITTIGSATSPRILQKIEDVRTFAGQTATISWYGRSSTSTTIAGAVGVNQNFGSGGSAAVSVVSTTITYTSDWQRFTRTFVMPSISGKTIGTNSFLDIRFLLEAADGANLDIWGVQLEAGSVATAFQTATGTIQGELAACQRYYYRLNLNVGKNFGSGMNNTTTGTLIIDYPVPMRVTPTALEQSGTAADYSLLTSVTTVTAGTTVPTAQTFTDINARFNIVTAGVLVAGACMGRAVNADAFLAWSAEL
jgi:hypothetical protein